MASAQIASRLKKEIELVLKLQGQPWSAVVDNQEYQSALVDITEFIGVNFGLTTNYEVFRTLHNPKAKLLQSLQIFDASENLLDYAATTTLDNSGVATLLYEYQDYLAQQSEDQLKGKQRKTTQQWVKDILDKQRKTPTALAAAVAVKLANKTAGTPSNNQIESALAEEKASREKTLEISSARGIQAVENLAETTLKQVGEDQHLNLSLAQQQDAKTAIVAAVIVGAIPLTPDGAKQALGEEQVAVIERQLAETAKQAGIEPAKMQRLVTRNTTSELVAAVLNEVEANKVPTVIQINQSLDKLINFDELAQNAQTTTIQTHEVLKTHQGYYLPPATTSLTDSNTATVARAYNAAFPETPLSPYPSYQSAQVITAVQAHDVNNQGFAKALELHSRGLTLDGAMRAIAFAKRDKNSALGQLHQQQPQTFAELERQLGQIQRSPLGNELNRRLTPFQLRYLQFTSRFTTFLPGRFGGAINFVTNPGGYLAQTLGKRAGSLLASRLASSAALASVKSAVLSLGAKTGLASLAAKAGLLAAGIGTGPVGWAIAAIQIGIQVGNAVFRPVLDFVGAKSLGEVVRNSVVGGVVLLATLPMLVISSLSLAALVPLSFIAVIGVILFVYIPTINIAPILSTMVQLETVPSSFITLNPADILPPGEVPASCPVGYPSALHKVSQGPDVGTHKIGFSVNLRDGGVFPSQHQAIDFAGGPIAVSATHDGQAYAFPPHTPGLAGFGNFVVVLAECQGIKFVTAYAHLTSPSIPLGGPTAVTKGQTLGLSGNSGTLGDGYHLHYEIMAQGQPFDILSWINR